MWFTVGPSSVPVSMHVWRICSSTVPELYGYFSVHSSIKLTLLQSSLSPVPALRFRAPRLPTWVSALFSTSSHCSHSTRRPPSRWRIPRQSQPFVCFCNATCKPISSCSRVQDPSSRSGGCPLSAAFDFHQAGSAHAVELPYAHLQAGCHARAPRLRRLTPHRAAVHEFGV